MKALNNSQLNEVVGGNIWVGLGIVAFIIFLAILFIPVWL